MDWILLTTKSVCRFLNLEIQFNLLKSSKPIKTELDSIGLFERIEFLNTPCSWCFPYILLTRESCKPTYKHQAWHKGPSSHNWLAALYLLDVLIVKYANNVKPQANRTVRCLLFYLYKSQSAHRIETQSYFINQEVTELLHLPLNKKYYRAVRLLLFIVQWNLMVILGWGTSPICAHLSNKRNKIIPVFSPKNLIIHSEVSKWSYSFGLWMVTVSMYLP